MDTATSEQITSGLGIIDDETQVMPDRPVNDYLVGPKSSEPVAHGWTTESIIFNHLDENVEKVMNKPMSTVAAVIITRDRPSDRPSGADAYISQSHRNPLPPKLVTDKSTRLQLI
ncbi:hypothetical protein B0H13DRAFT_2674380 [Mycena leptocephala]|nr:hypothetical protein B0H13DRAFT_2674380 [Mycena leptocephala]